jgi:hypothetical protein
MKNQKPAKVEKTPEPPKYDATFYLTQGLIWVGIVGAVLSGILLKFLQKILDPSHPLNTKFKDAPVWVPGTILLAGPLLGLLYYVVFKTKIDAKRQSQADLKLKD